MIITRIEDVKNGHSEAGQSAGKGRPVCKVNVTNNAYDQLQDIYRSIAEDALSYVEKKFGCF